MRALFSGLLLLSGTLTNPGQTPTPTSSGEVAATALSGPAGGLRSGPGFQRLAPAATGVSFTNLLSDAEGARNRTLYNGSGVAAGDLDGDGWPDLVFARLQGGVELFRNLGGWRFTNVTASSGLDAMKLPARGVVLADVTGDGATDLLVSAHGHGVRCWRNDGRGRFTDATVEAGTGGKHGSMTLALADVDGNGTLDLYIANNRTDDIRDSGQVQLRMVGGKIVVPPALADRLVMIDGQPQEYGEPDRLLLNDGTGRFREVSWTGGVFTDESGQPLTRPPLDWGLSVTFRDLNGDGAPDLYVCNDFWTPDRLWLNDGRGRFQAAPALSLRHTSGSSMGVDMADLDADGRPEIFVVDMLSRQPAWRKRQLEAQPPRVDPPGLITNRPQILRNTLFHARDDGTYAEIADRAGLAAAEWAWQPLFLDVDLDGHPDLLITSGHMHDVQDRDAEAQVRGRQRSFQGIRDPVERRTAFLGDLHANMLLYPPLETPIVAFRNRGDMRFDDVTTVWGTDTPAVHHGIASADFDGDGDLDLAVNALNSAAILLRNESTAPRVAVRLRGLAPNTGAVGARVTLRGGAVPVQTQEVVNGGRYLSGSDPLLVFAAGTNESPMTLEVRWRNGTERRLSGIRAGHRHDIVQDPRLDLPPAAKPPTSAPNPWFKDLSSHLNHTHQDLPFDDFARQPLLPWRLSQSGPGIAWGDLDGDGWEDLFVGTGAAGTVAAFKNDGGRTFRRWEQPPFHQLQARDTTGLVVAPGNNGRPVLLAGSSSYEDSLTNAACLLEFALNGPAPRPLLRDLPSSVGPLALADMDADGNLDLFVGTRVRRSRWPEATGSVLLHRQGEQWVVDQTHSALLANLGCVAAATWTDLNRDGFPELIVAGEWGPPRVFRNDRGRLSAWEWTVVRAGAPGGPLPLSALTGLWNSVAAGDFDGDGRMDLILGNWGENSPLRASTERPLTLVAGSWRGDDSLALIETEFDPATRARTPVRPLRDLVSELPFLAGQFATHRAFAEATLDQVLRDAPGAAKTFHASTLTSTLLLNRAGTFEARPLPTEAQLTPVFGVAVADFDGNGTEDVFLAQNFFALRPGSARLDAGRGLVLSGDGRGGFSPLSTTRSGVILDGEQRGAAVADFDHDGRTDLVVTQNGAPTRLFQNVFGRPGIRIRLRGGAGNPGGLGGILQLTQGGISGPAREIHGGGGYGSHDGVTSVLAWPQPASTDPAELTVQWPGGKTTRHRLPASTLEYDASLNP